ncbi:MAG TPA: hypothetical protein VK203_05980 [Nostocaceae cyanobacterium]|nr:hypothetical protein [Nostocaceae cyanobacterium]
MSELLRFEPYLSHIDYDLLVPSAKVWGGKGSTRKQDCINTITKGLKNPQTVASVIAQLKPFERLALEIVRENGGEIEAENLLLRLRLLGAKDLPELHQQYERDYMVLTKYLVKRGIFLYKRDLSIYTSFGIIPGSLFTDERLLAQLDKVPLPQLPLTSVTPPKTTTFRRPTTVVLNILGMLRTIEQQGGLKVTQKGTIQVNSLKKFAKLQNWQLEKIEVDGFDFPEPADAFTLAFLRSNLLTDNEEETAFVLETSVEEFAKWSPQEQVNEILSGLVESPDWAEWSERSWYNEELYYEARQIILFVLKILPAEGRDWIDFNEFEELLFKRIGENFSISSRPQYPRYFNNQDEKTAVESWRTRLRQEWIGQDRIWLKYVLSTWLYYLGIVELGLERFAESTVQNETVVCFRLTDLGRTIFYPHLAGSIGNNKVDYQPAWIVQPNFEIMVYLEEVNPVQLALLERYSDRLDVQQHVARYKLTKNSVYKGCENGLSFNEFLTALREGCKVNLPQNVEIEIQQWGNLNQEITLHQEAQLLEFPEKKTRDAAVEKDLKGKPIGDRFVLVSNSETAKQYVCYRFEYDQSLPPCLSINKEGVVTLDIGIPDLLIHEQLNRWMESKGNNKWQITRASVTKAIKSGAKIEALLEFLQFRCTNKVPKFLQVAIQNWGGKPETVEIAEVLVLRCTNSTVFKAITSSTKITPYLLGKLAPDILLVDERQYSELESELEWAGFKISDKLIDVPKVKE